MMTEEKRQIRIRDDSKARLRQLRVSYDKQVKRIDTAYERIREIMHDKVEAEIINNKANKAIKEIRRWKTK